LEAFALRGEIGLSALLEGHGVCRLELGLRALFRFSIGLIPALTRARTCLFSAHACSSVTKRKGPNPISRRLPSCRNNEIQLTSGICK
jgi:hypothetical protein